MKNQLLQGRAIVVTRPAGQADGLVAQLRAHGAEPIICPAIAIAPPSDYAALDAALARLPSYDWLIFTSANGVRALLDRLAALGHDSAALASLRIGAIGPATAAALAARGLRADFVPSAYVAESILDEIEDVAGKRILLPRADIARDALAAGLRARGATVDALAAYRTVPGDGAPALAERLRAGRIDAVTFTSSSTVRYLLDGLDAAGVAPPEARALLNAAAIICIGPITAATAAESGLRVDAVAREYTAEGLVAMLVEWFAAPSAALER